ncbi:lytic murein transglycosylase, partial [Salmonella enterica subsp. enterica serovar Typhimurium]|nr:lytic murein transglycosylase [Salmonella enterica subsp. enterica serovar Typhimurium]
MLLIILAMMLQAAERSQPPARIVIQTDDVTRF